MSDPAAPLTAEDVGDTPRGKTDPEKADCEYRSMARKPPKSLKMAWNLGPDFVEANQAPGPSRP